MKHKLLVIALIVFVATCGESRAAVDLLQGQDTSCAVVLYNGAKYVMEASLDDVMVRKSYHRKVKILSEEGLRYASVAIPYYRFMEYTERVSGIKVTVSSGQVDAEGGWLKASICHAQPILCKCLIVGSITGQLPAYGLNVGVLLCIIV